MKGQGAAPRAHKYGTHNRSVRKKLQPISSELTLVCLCASTAEFSIWTREAGAGGLSIAVEGPSKAEIAFEDHKDGSCGVSYIVQEPGTYRD